MDETAKLDKVLWDTGASGTGYPWRELDDDLWKVRNDDSTLTLQLFTSPPNVSDKFRLLYRVRPATLSADSGTGGVLTPDIEPFAAYVCARASAILCHDRSLKEQEAAKRDFWLTKFQLFQAMADGIMSADAEPKPAGRVIYPTWGDTTTGNARVDPSISLPVDNIRISS